MKKVVRDFIEKLLIIDPNQRIPASEFKYDNFFEVCFLSIIYKKGIDYEKLENKEIEPPFIPKLLNPYDTHYFVKRNQEYKQPEKTDLFENF